jgi:predicted HAD superfamily Cof-like phosphohydrolase
MMCEELAETINEIAAGHITPYPPRNLTQMASDLKALGQMFKEGYHLGDFVRANRTEVLDGMLDNGWVAIAAALSISNNAKLAMAEVARANLDKYPNGVVTKDPVTSKILKPEGWRGPDLSPYLDSTGE